MLEQVSNLSDRKRELIDNIETNENELDKQNKNLKTLKESLIQTEKKREKLGHELEKKRKDFNKQLSDLSKEHEELSIHTDSHKCELDKLKNMKKTICTEISASKATSANTKEKIDTQIKELETIKEQLLRKEKEMGDLDTEIQKRESHFGGLCTQIESKECEYEELGKQLERKSEQLSVRRRDVEQEVKILQTLKEEKESVQENVQDLTKSVEILNIEKTALEHQNAERNNGDIVLQNLTRSLRQKLADTQKQLKNQKKSKRTLGLRLQEETRLRQMMEIERDLVKMDRELMVRELSNVVEGSNESSPGTHF